MDAVGRSKYRALLGFITTSSCYVCCGWFHRIVAEQLSTLLRRLPPCVHVNTNDESPAYLDISQQRYGQRTNFPALELKLNAKLDTRLTEILHSSMSDRRCLIKVKISACLLTALLTSHAGVQKRFTISEEAADWHELMIYGSALLRPSIGRVSEQLDPR